MPGKVKSMSEIAQEYGVHRSTLYDWIKPIKAKLKLNRKALKVWQIQIIYEFLDRP